MPKIEPNLSEPTKAFNLDSVPYQRGGYEIVLDGDNVGLNRMNARSISSSIIISPVPFSEWTDASDTPFATLGDLMTALTDLLFISGSGGGGGSTAWGTITGDISNQTDLSNALSSKMGNTLETVLAASSSATSQLPSGTDTPLQVEFGAAQGTGGDPVQIDAAGNITFNEADTYFLRVAIHFGRVGAAGASELRFRSLINGVPVGEVIAASIENADALSYINVTIIAPTPATDVLTFEIMRDSSGNDSGGLYAVTSTPVDWTNAPCARILIQRFI